MYRALTGTGMLVVLDNAADVDQVRALLPGAGATVLVTSRDRIDDLGVREGAYGLALEPMTEAESLASLAARLDRSRLTGQGSAVITLIEACAGLPLALGIVGTRLEAHPDEPLAMVAAQLARRSDRLDVLDGLRTVISWSDRFDPDTCSAPLRPRSSGLAGPPRCSACLPGRVGRSFASSNAPGWCTATPPGDTACTNMSASTMKNVPARSA
jgi:hypothetical protein